MRLNMRWFYYIWDYVVFIHMRLNILDGFIILIYFIGIDLAKYGEGLKLIKIYIFIFKIFRIKINLH